MEIPRYSVVLDPEGGDPMEPDAEGSWVRYEDVQHLIESAERYGPIEHETRRAAHQVNDALIKLGTIDGVVPIPGPSYNEQLGSPADSNGVYEVTKGKW